MESSIRNWYKNREYITDEYLQMLIDMYTKRNMFCIEYMILLEEKLKRNEIY